MVLSIYLRVITEGNQDVSPSVREVEDVIHKDVTRKGVVRQDVTNNDLVRQDTTRPDVALQDVTRQGVARQGVTRKDLDVLMDRVRRNQGKKEPVPLKRVRESIEDPIDVLVFEERVIQKMPHSQV